MDKVYEIVIVEDNPNDAELMLRSLGKKYSLNNLIVLEDGEQALNFIFCRDEYVNRKGLKLPSVIFLDLKLPKVDGLEVLRQLKLNDLTRKIPVIIVTSSQENPDIHVAYELGANSYVVKPVDYRDFSERMNQLGLYWLLVNKTPQ